MARQPTRRERREQYGAEMMKTDVGCLAVFVLVALVIAGVKWLAHLSGHGWTVAGIAAGAVAGTVIALRAGWLVMLWLAGRRHRPPAV